jgi:hypothetical protein
MLPNLQRTMIVSASALAAIGLLSVVFSAKYPSDPTKAAADRALNVAQEAAKKQENDRFQEAIYVARMLRKNMKNPDSFKLEEVLRMPDGSLCFSYRAANSFNAVTPGNAVYAAGKLTANDAAWNKYCGGKTGTVVTGLAMAY